LLLPLLCVPLSSRAGEGSIASTEISIGGIVIGETPAQVRKKLGKPLRESRTSGFLDLHYDYPAVRVSFNEQVVAGLESRSSQGCTPEKLCPGDSVERMRSLYGPPMVVDRETGRYFEYYPEDHDCWLQISANAGKVKGVAVACQP